MMEVIINKSFYRFLKKYNKVILKIFNIVASFKKYCPNTYYYNKNFPPLRKNFKYTDKLFIGCILYVTVNNSSWNSFIGPISGKQVHKKFMEYSRKNVFKDVFNDSINEYLKRNHETKLEVISVDSTNIQNRNCKELIHRNPYNKNKRSAKVSAIVDSNGIPIGITVDDSKLFHKVFDNVIKNKALVNKINKNITLLADKGYDSKIIRNKIKKSKMKCIIAHNKRNTKDKSKIKSLNNYEKIIYKKRVKVEHFFGAIKYYPKINCVYEKTLSSYKNLVLIVSSMKLINENLR